MDSHYISKFSYYFSLLEVLSSCVITDNKQFRKANISSRVTWCWAYLVAQICRWHHPYGRKWRGNKEPLDESESGEWKSWLKAQHSEDEDHGIWFHHFMGNRWGNRGNSVRLYFSGLQNHCRWWLQPWN